MAHAPQLREAKRPRSPPTNRVRRSAKGFLKVGSGAPVPLAAGGSEQLRQARYANASENRSNVVECANHFKGQNLPVFKRAILVLAAMLVGLLTIPTVAASDDPPTGTRVEGNCVWLDEWADAG